VSDVRIAARSRKLKYVFFWKPRARGDALSPAVFSNWERAPFELDGNRFPTTEHYLMWRKAVLFDDTDAATRILAAPSPTAVKALGRGVRGFDEGLWFAHRFQIVVDGNLAKFRTHADLRHVLVGTGERVIAEASPADRVWGIGLSETDSDAQRPDAWRGLNLLGFALMNVRAQLQ
jgi:ribA/ribD-fused uncharacterized protein